MPRKIVKPGGFVPAAKSVEMHISTLQIGMYVSKLDRDWLDTPFLLQGFVIESLADIDMIAEYCEHVWIDTVEEEWVAPDERATPNYKAPRNRYINKLAAQDEHRKALSVYTASKSVAKEILEGVRLSGAIDTRSAKKTVDDCVNSVLRNPDALLWMSRLRESDSYTSEHCLNVCILAIVFGRHLGMDEAQLQSLGLCGLLHDVGKMRIPNDVLNKPGKLTDKEMNMVKAHPVHGRNLLMSAKGVPLAAVDVAYGHHERMDGEGYPRKLKASGISEYSRIIAIVDAFDAMTADRCYAPSMASTDALKNIFKDRGTHFDDRLALEFIKVIGLYPPGSIVELVNGSIGLVLSKNHRFAHMPRVILVLGENKQAVDEKILNLAEVDAGNLDKGYLIRRVVPDGSHGVTIKDYQERGLRFGQMT